MPINSKMPSDYKLLVVKHGEIIKSVSGAQKKLSEQMAALRKASEFQARIHSQWTSALQKKVSCSMFIVPCLTELFSRYQTKGKRSNRYENKSKSTEDRMLRPKVPMSRTIIKM